VPLIDGRGGKRKWFWSPLLFLEVVVEKIPAEKDDQTTSPPAAMFKIKLSGHISKVNCCLPTYGYTSSIRSTSRGRGIMVDERLLDLCP
jgi:hypothetical protein